ncbi:putative primosomal domain protein [Escherichia phage YDC107_2]|nr:putative primosomal domain protein [Escherichia phage YDC107_2]
MHHDPGANNAVMNNFVPPGGLGQLGKFVMHEQWRPSDDFFGKAHCRGSTWTVCQRHRNLQSSEFTGWLRVRHTIRHSGSRSWQGGCRLADRSNQHYLITTFRTGTALKHGGFLVNNVFTAIQNRDGEALSRMSGYEHQYTNNDNVVNMSAERLVDALFKQLKHCFRRQW